MSLWLGSVQRLHRHFRSGILALLVLCAAWIPLTEAAGALDVSIPDVVVEASGAVVTVAVPVLLNNDTGIPVSAAEFLLFFDSIRLTAVGTSTAGTLSEGWATPSAIRDGMIAVVLAGAFGRAGSGTLINVLFEVDASRIGPTQLILSKVKVNGDTPTTVTNGSIVIGTGMVVVEPTSAFIGESVTVEGVGLTAGRFVTIEIDDVDVTPEELVVSIDGTFTATIIVPRLSEGVHSVRVMTPGAEEIIGSLSVWDPNDPPTFLPISDQVMDEDEPLDITITGIGPGVDDEAGQTVSIDARSSDPSIVPHPVIDGTGDTRTMSIVPIPDASGEVEITIIATDDGLTGGVHNNVFSATFLVTVRPINDMPTLVADISGRTLAVGGSVVISLSVTDPDSETFEINIEEAPSQGSVVANDSALTVTYRAGATVGSDSFAVSVSDSDGGVSETFVVEIAITVSPDQPPVVSQGIVIDVRKNVPVVIALSQYVVHPSKAPLTFSLDPVGIVTNGKLALVGSTATYTPATGYVGSDGFIFSVSDGVSSITGIVQINVVNATPTVEGGPAETDEDTAVAIPFTVADDDGDEVTLRLESDSKGGIVVLEGLVATYTPNPEFHGTDTFTVVPNDGVQDGTRLDVVVTVIEVDDPAELNPARFLSSILVRKGSSAHVIDLGGEQPLFLDRDSEVTYAAASSDSDVVEATVNDTLLTIEFVGVGIATVTVTVTGAAEKAIFVVEIVVPNEPPTFLPILDQTAHEDEPLEITITGIGPGADHEASQTVSIEATSSDPSIVSHPVIDGAGDTRTMSIVPFLDASGEVEITIIATDDGLTGGLHNNVSSGTFLVTVVAHNDMPTLDVLDDIKILEDAPSQTLSLFPPAFGPGGGVDERLQKVILTASSSDPNVIPHPVVFSEDYQTPGDDLHKSIIFAPVLNQHGDVEITVTATDDGRFTGKRNMNSFERTFLVSVSPVNDLPLVAKMAASTTYQNVPVDIVIQASDVEGDVLSVSTVSPPKRGDLNPPSYPLTDGEITLTYTPEWDFAGTDTFTFVVRDGTDASEPITASIEVLPNERPTVSVGDNVKLTVVQGLPIVIPFDVDDPDGDAVSVNVLSRPINGAVFTDSDLLGVLYTSNEAFVGTDTFVIAVTDTIGAISKALQVVVEVTLPNRPPVIAAPEPVVAPKNMFTILIMDVSDPDGDEIIVVPESFPLNGTMEINGLVVTYIPLPGFVGLDTFSVRALEVPAEGEDPALALQSDEITFHIDVPNALPVAEPTSAETYENAAVFIPLLGSDPDFDAITFTLTTPPSSGEALIQGVTATYTPNPGFSGSDEFEIVAFDGLAQSEPVTVQVTVNPVNDPPVMSLDPTSVLTVEPGNSLSIAFFVEDPDSETFLVDIVQAPTQGSVEPFAEGVGVTYTASEDAMGEDSFVARVFDDAVEPLPSNELPVTINILILDQTPVVTDVGPLSGPKHTVIEVSLVGEDPNGDELTFQVSRAPEHGAVTIDGRRAFYTPEKSFSGEDSFAYMASDGEFVSAPGEVLLTIENAVPVADATTALGVEDEPVVVELAGSDADGDPLTFEIAKQPRRGEVTLDGQAVTYTPRADFSGTDEFSFTVTDGDVVSDPAVVTLEIEAFDDPPTRNLDRSISDIRATEGDLPRTLRLSDPTPLFVDPDSPVTVGVGSSDLEVVEPFLGDASLTLTFVNPGTATVTVSAKGSSEVVSFQVDVVALELRNDPPELRRLLSQMAVEGEDLIMTPAATDPEEDTLIWSLVSIERFETASEGDTEPVVVVDPDTGVTTFNVENITGLQARFSVEISVADEVNDPVSISTLILVTSSNEPPVVSAPAEVISEVDETITFDVTVTDPDGDEVTITASVREREGDIISTSQSALRSFNRADVALDGDTSVKTFSFTPTDLVAGRIITMQWVADDGQASATGSTQIQVGEDVNLPPTIDTISDQEVEEGGSIVIAVIAEDPDAAPGEEVVVTAGGLPAGAVFDAATGSITWPDIGFDRAGSYTFTVTAVDVGGLEAVQTFRLRVMDMNREPELTASSPATPDALPASITLQRLTVLTLDFGASDPDGDNVTLTVRGVPGWARMKQGGSPTTPRVSIDMEPPRDAEDLTVSVTATDSGGLTARVEVAIVLEDPPNTDPTIEQIAPITVVEEETASFTVDVSDEDGDELAVTAAALPEGATFDGATFIWTPERGQSQDDPYAIALTVDDGNGGQAEMTVQITVLQAANRNPEIATIDDVTVVEGETATVTAAVTDLDGDQTQMEVQTDFLASNMSVDQATGEIIFATEAGVEGAGEGFYPVTVLATDTRDGQTMVTFLLAVDPLQATDTQELVIRAALVSPKLGTAEDTFSFAAIVTTLGGDPDSVTLTVVSADGTSQESAMGPVGAAAATGARYAVDLVLPPGTYTFTVTAVAGAESATRDEAGPVVEEALIDISNAVISGSTEDISVQFDLSNPNPGQTVTLGVEFRNVDTEAWLPASVSGSISALRTGSHAFTWHSTQDIPDALGETYQLRLTAGTSGERISDGFRLVNASLTSPALDELVPSADSSLVITGASEILHADIDIFLDDQNVGTTQVEDDGIFRFVTADLQPGTYELRATASILGVSSVKSVPVEVVVDSAPPTLEVISPERGSEVPTLEPLITFRVDFGLSGGDPADVAVTLNGKPTAVTFDGTSQLYSVREKLFDQRLYVASVRASKFNGLTLSSAWAFTVNLAAGDEIAPMAVSSEPTGSINENSPTVQVVVSDGETGIDTESVEVLLNGVPVATTYSPKDENSGSAVGVPTDPLEDGDYTASATFTDLAGNTGDTEWSFTVDTTPPAVPTFTSPTPADASATTSVATFTVEGIADPESEVVIVVGGTIAGTATPGADGAWAFSVDLAAGTTDVRTQARDALKNVSELSDTVSIVLDAELPQIILAAPALEAATPNLLPTFSGVVTDALSGIDPASVTLEIDSAPVGVTFDEAAGTFSYDAVAPFETGTTIQVRIAATDGAGNAAEITGSVTFDATLSDITAPSILNPQINGIGLVAGTATLIQTSDATIQFTVTDDLSGVERVFGTLDGAEVEFTVSDTSATLTLAGLAEGSHVLLVSATDVAGNAGEPQQFDFILDVGTTPPVLTAPALTNAPDLVVQGTGIEDGATVNVLVNGVPVETIVQGVAFQTGVVSLQEGENTITATATDAVGNTADGEPITVTLDSTPPELAFLAPLSDSTVNASTDTIVIWASDAVGLDTTRVDLTVDGGTVSPSVGGDGTITYVAAAPFASSGTDKPASHFASIVVGDLAGNTSRLGAQFFVDGTAPTVQGFIPAANEVVPSLEPSISGTIVATDLDLSSVDVLVGPQDTTLSSIVGSPNYEFDPRTGQFSFFPLLEDKTTYQVVVSAADKVGNIVVATWEFVIDTEAEDTTEPSTTVLFPQPGENINEVSLDILSFAVGDSAGIGSVTMFVNDPTGTSPLSIGQLEEEGTAKFNRRTGVIRIFGRRLLAPRQGARGGFSFDPLELNALERSLTGGDNASFDPLELNALERSLGGDAGGADIGTLEQSLGANTGMFGAGDNTMGVNVLDLSGNISFASWSFAVTLDPPAAPTFSAATALRNSRSASFDGVIPGLVVSGGLPLTVALRVNGTSSGIVTVTSVDGEFTFDNVNLSDGDNFITAMAQDSAGNLSDRSDTLTVVLDEVAPTVAIDPVAPEASSTFFTITGSISDNQPVDLGSVVLHVNDDEIELSKSQGRFTQSLTLGDGSNTLRVVVQDAAGNETTSDTYTVTLDLAAPTTAPENITALPTADGRGIRLGWTADANAATYNVYRSLVAFDDASGLTPVAASVEGTGYTDTTVLSGRIVYYAVASVDGAGNSDASVLSPVLPVALMKAAGGVAALEDGTSLRVPRSGLFANALLTGTVEISTPLSTPELGAGIDGTAREVVVLTSSGAILQAFNLPAALTHRVPVGIPIAADSPRTYRLVTQDWEGLTSATNAPLRTVTADIPGSGVYQLGEPASAAPWDVNGDGTVNIVDLVTVASVFGQSVSAGDPADTNGDGVVNIIDLVTVSTHFGETTGTVNASAPAADGDPVVTLYTRVVELRGGRDEVVVVVESSVNLAGYEMVIDPGAGEIKSMTHGDVFGREVFWMDPAPVEGSTRIAAVRLDLASTGIPVRMTGILTRLSLYGASTSGEDMLRLRDIRFTDRKGELLPYRIVAPPVVDQRFRTALLPNYPNPFNPETWIPFSLSQASETTLRIYDIDGQVIRTLELGAREAGSYASRERAAYWDGRNDLGEKVASGVYFYELSADAYREIRRMVILK